MPGNLLAQYLRMNCLIYEEFGRFAQYYLSYLVWHFGTCDV